MGSERREVIGDKCEVNKDCRRIRPECLRAGLINMSVYPQFMKLASTNKYAKTF
jgi:hypothetical protein